MITRADAWVQHYPALAYFGQYLREIVRNLLHGVHPAIPTWDLSLGYGGDILTTLHYYGLGDPLTLLSGFFPLTKAELCYEMLIGLRLYLSGLSFLAFRRYFGRTDYSTVLGALTYVFSAYAIAPGVFHPFFAIPMIWFPLLLLGAEKLYHQESPVCFILVVALSAMSNYYFFYMQAVLLAGYAAIRYLACFRPFRLRECLGWIGRFLGFALIGVGIAAPIWAPNMLSILQSSRISAEHSVPLLYSEDYYRSFLAAFLSIYDRNYLYISTGALGVLAMGMLWSHPRKKGSILRTCIVILLILALLPCFGSLMNGMAYPTNRWIWALCFAIGIAVAEMLPVLEIPAPRRFAALFGILLLYLAVTFLLDPLHDLQLYVSAGLLLAALSFGALLQCRKLQTRYFRVGVSAVCVLSVMSNCYFWVAPAGHNWKASSMNTNEIFGLYANTPLGPLSALPNSDQVRYDSESSRIPYNDALLYDLNGTSYYYSAATLGTISFQRGMQMNAPLEQRYRNLDGRAYLEAALGVHYFIPSDDLDRPRPYGYDISVGSKEMPIYTTEHTLPLVYAFDSVYVDDPSLTAAQRQQMLLQCAVAEETYGLPMAEPVFTDEKIPFTAAASDGILMEGNTITVTQADATLTLEFSPVTGAELYLLIDGLDWIRPGQHEETTIHIQIEDQKRTIHYLSPKSNFYCDVHDFFANLGYDAGAAGSVTICFSQPGTYTTDGLCLVAQPMDAFADQTAKLRNSGVSQLVIGSGTIQFRTDRASDAMVCAAVPYQKGWTATVDGRPTPVHMIQSGLCGLVIPEGSHEILMTYRTPMMNVWLLCSGLSVAVVAGIAIYRKKTR